MLLLVRPLPLPADGLEKSISVSVSSPLPYEVSPSPRRLAPLRGTLGRVPTEARWDSARDSPDEERVFHELTSD